MEKLKGKKLEKIEKIKGEIMTLEAIDEDKIRSTAEKINADIELKYNNYPTFVDQGEIGATVEKHKYLEGLNSVEIELLSEILADEYYIHTYQYDKDYFSIGFTYGAYLVESYRDVVRLHPTVHAEDIKYSELLDSLNSEDLTFFDKFSEYSKSEVVELVVIYNQLITGDFKGVFDYSSYGSSETLRHYRIGEEFKKYYAMNRKEATREIENILNEIDSLVNDVTYFSYNCVYYTGLTELPEFLSANDDYKEDEYASVSEFLIDQVKKGKITDEDILNLLRCKYYIIEGEDIITVG